MSTPPSAARVEPEPLAGFAEDVRTGLLGHPKRLTPRWFYDALGSALFEAICRLPWYRITRSESALLARHADVIAEAAGPDASFVELGAGSGEKLALVIEAATRRGHDPSVHLVDVSTRALDLAAATLARFPGVPVARHETTYEAGLRDATAAPANGRRVVLFLGSNIGNFDPEQAGDFLTDVRRALRPGDLMLLGADLVKPSRDLLLAYDDPLGLTAAFNKNVLLRINRELEGDADLASFAHEARWNAAASRVEMHLVSLRPQVIAIPRADCEVSLDRGESIWTESSYKFEPARIVQMAASAGLGQARQWVDGAAGFALSLFTVG